MRLSEAIRLGSMMGRQLYRELIDGSNSCAIGAALLANGQRVRFAIEAKADETWPVLNARARCPRCASAFQGGTSSTDDENVWGVVVHLNNDHKMTRERIADWVESIENAQVAKVGEAGCAEAVPTGSEPK